MSNEKQLKTIEHAVRGTRVSNRTEWLVIVPILILLVVGAWYLFASLHIF